MTPSLIFHAVGDFDDRHVHVVQVESTRPVLPEIESLIEQTWREEKRRRPDRRLFDGPMCRLEGWHHNPSDGGLYLSLSQTSYRIFLGTNLSHPEWADQYGREILANPVGASPALVSSDGYLLMGVRNDRVAYHPNRVHPFAGAVEPRDGGKLFNTVRRELSEELGFTSDDIAEIRLTGIAEDTGMRQPELIFRVGSTRTRSEIIAKLDRDEHHETWSIPATRQAVEIAIQDTKLTPVAVASLLLWGRAQFGEDWFAHATRTAKTPSAPRGRREDGT